MVVIWRSIYVVVYDRRVYDRTVSIDNTVFSHQYVLEWIGLDWMDVSIDYFIEFMDDDDDDRVYSVCLPFDVDGIVVVAAGVFFGMHSR